MKITVEKYYCDRCRKLYNEEVPCAVCGVLVKKKIQIEVQNQSTQYNKSAPE